MSDYSRIKDQISYGTTGAQKCSCPVCGKGMTARVSGEKKYTYGPQIGRRFRRVTASCRHCGMSYSFDWK